jgi:hypothetical protein
MMMKEREGERGGGQQEEGKRYFERLPSWYVCVVYSNSVLFLKKYDDHI